MGGQPKDLVIKLATAGGRIVAWRPADEVCGSAVIGIFITIGGRIIPYDIPPFAGSPVIFTVGKDNGWHTLTGA